MVHNLTRSKWSLSIEEAALIFSITKMIAPKVILEFGTHTGFSAANFLNAMDCDSILYSVDLAKRHNIVDSRFKFIQKDQNNFKLQDIRFQYIDLLFIDCSHHFKSNVKTFKVVRPRLHKNAVIVVHDTAIWAGRPDEVKFAEWLERQYNRIDFHCDKRKSWGLSVFQKSKKIRGNDIKIL